MKKIIIDNKKFIIIYSFLILVSIISIVFTFNNYSFYKKNIAVITKVEEKLITEEKTANYTEKEFEQTIYAKVKNGKYKNKNIVIKNNYYMSNTYEQKYNKNDEIFIDINEFDGDASSIYISGVKRDKYIVILVVALLLTITLIGKLKGFLSLISVLINTIIFSVIIYLNTKGISLIFLTYISTIIFSIICLLLVSGFNNKTKAAIISSIIGVTITTIISLLVIYFTNYSGIRFDQMQISTRPYQNIFAAEIIMGGLGAIMDISITISSALNELIEKNNKISIDALRKSGTEIGKDVTSTMINVLFFTYICTAIPNLAIFYRNGISIGYLATEYISLELTRALVGAIGIVVTIPVAIFTTIIIYKRRLNND